MTRRSLAALLLAPLARLLPKPQPRQPHGVIAEDISFEEPAPIEYTETTYFEPVWTLEEAQDRAVSSLQRITLRRL